MKDRLEIWVIYDHPKDYPSHFVVRKQTPMPNGDIQFSDAILADTLEKARSVIPPFLVKFMRDPGDDPVIVESWL